MNSLLHIALSNAVLATALALVAVVVGRFCRRPALTHGLWLLVLLKLVTPPLLKVPVGWPASSPVLPAGPSVSTTEPVEPSINVPFARGEPDEPEAFAPAEEVVLTPGPAIPADASPPSPPPAPATIPAEPFAVPAGWMAAGVVLWLAGTASWTGLAAVRVRRFRRLLRYAQPAPLWLREEVHALASRLGLRRVPGVWLVPGRLAPMLWAVGSAPRLLVPVGLLDGLTDEQRATLLLHELAHLRRRDHWVRVLEMLTTALYWWHPVVWWARRELREAEEQCCDAWVVWALPGAGRTYATALLECLDFLSDAPSPLPLGASGIGQTNDLKRRLTMIMRGITPRRLSWGSGVVLAGVGLMLLPLVPSFAQEEDRRRDPRDDRREESRDERRDTKPGSSKEEIDKAREEVERVKKELDAQLTKLRATEERLRAAAVHLARLEGKQVEKRDIRIIIGDGAGWRHERVVPGEGRGWRIERSPAPETVRPGADRDPRRPQLPGTPAPGGGRPSDRDSDRLRAVERRLEEVIKQLEKMQRQMQGPRDRRPEGPRDDRPADPAEKRPQTEPPPVERREGSRIEIEIDRDGVKRERRFDRDRPLEKRPER
jgi:beta-lactamase regulating signal transducer with metallopeptidase domain